MLVVALQAYFDDPSEAVLNRLYDAVTAMDLAMAPTLSRCERLIMRQMDRREIFAEKQHQHQQQQQHTQLQLQQQQQQLEPPTNASVESFAGRTRAESMLSKVDGDSTLVDAESTFTVETDVSSESLGRPLPTARPPPEKDTAYHDGRLFQTTVTYQSRPSAPPVTLPMRVPLSSFPEDVGEVCITYTRPTVR